MAHEVEQMLYVGETPWHGLGKRFIEAPTLDEAIIAAGLNWKVTTEPLFAGNGEKAPALLTRRDMDGSILGVVGPSYQPLQNDKAFEFFKPFIDNKEAAIECAGSLRLGKRVFVLAKINRDPIVVKGSDVVDKYILLSNSHDGTLAVRVGFTPIRVVCANTLAMAHDNTASKLIRVKHSGNVEMNLEKIRETMNVADAEFEATAEQYRLLASKEINSSDLEKYIKIVFATKKQLAEAEGNLEEVGAGSRIREQIINLFENGRGQNLAETKRTLFSAYNAVTEYVQYERGDDKQIRLDNTWFGQGMAINKKALEVAVTMATLKAA